MKSIIHLWPSYEIVVRCLIAASDKLQKTELWPFTLCGVLSIKKFYNFLFVWNDFYILHTVVKAMFWRKWEQYNYILYSEFVLIWSVTLQNNRAFLFTFYSGKKSIFAKSSKILLWAIRSRTIYFCPAFCLNSKTLNSFGDHPVFFRWTNNYLFLYTSHLAFVT